MRRPRRVKVVSELFVLGVLLEGHRLLSAQAQGAAVTPAKSKTCGLLHDILLELTAKGKCVHVKDDIAVQVVSLEGV